MIPPTRRASENEGALRNPMANDTPDGIHLAYHNLCPEAYVLNAEIKANKLAKKSMKIALFSGRLPSPVRLLTRWPMPTNPKTHEATLRG
jgi:hypothetical protein